MTVITDLLATLPSHPVAVRDVRIGAFWIVVCTSEGAGLASSMREPCCAHGESAISWAGDLLNHTAGDLAGLLRGGTIVERALGMAAVNAMTRVDESRIVDRNAAEEICLRGANRRVVVVGHFPFVPNVRRRVGHLDVLELEPGPGDLPAEAAAEVIPKADVVAITATSLVNGSFDQLIALCSPKAYVLVLGPTAPLATVLFDHGVDLLAGTLVTDPALAATTASQGAVFPQMKGVRLVTMARDRPRL